MYLPFTLKLDGTYHGITQPLSDNYHVIKWSAVTMLLNSIDMIFVPQNPALSPYNSATHQEITAIPGKFCPLLRWIMSWQKFPAPCASKEAKKQPKLCTDVTWPPGPGFQPDWAVPRQPSLSPARGHLGEFLHPSVTVYFRGKGDITLFLSWMWYLRRGRACWESWKP